MPIDGSPIERVNCEGRLSETSAELSEHIIDSFLDLSLITNHIWRISVIPRFLIVVRYEDHIVCIHNSTDLKYDMTYYDHQFKTCLILDMGATGGM